MDEDCGISNVEKPIRVIKPEPSQEVSRSKISESSIAHASTKQIEDGGYYDAEQSSLLHGLVLSRR